jgi:hypothetical protein
MPAYEEDRGEPFSFSDLLEIACDVKVFRGKDG